MTTTEPTILGLDPGTRFMGAVVVRGRELLAYAVHELWNGEQPFEVIGQARRIIFRYVEKYSPQAVVIEKPYLLGTKRAATLSTLTHELHERSKDFGLAVLELTPEEARHAVTGDPRSTKIETAEALVAMGFLQLAAKIPKRRSQSGLGVRPSDRYWLHVFDALALAVAVSVASSGHAPHAVQRAS